jgi:hypothetical protein
VPRPKPLELGSYCLECFFLLPKPLELGSYCLECFFLLRNQFGLVCWNFRDGRTGSRLVCEFSELNIDMLSYAVRIQQRGQRQHRKSSGTQGRESATDSQRPVAA